MPTTDSDGVTIWWDATGAGEPPLLLIQGLGYTAEMWWRVLPRLAERRRVIGFDNRGVGRSDVPEPPWSVEDMADDAAAVLDAAGAPAAHVLGVSMGGLLAQEFALRHPDRVVSLILGCTHPGGRGAARMDPDAAAMLTDRSPKSHRAAVDASLPFSYAADTPRERIEPDVEARLRFPLRAKGYFGQLDAMRHHPGTMSRLARIAVPTLVLHGTGDRMVQPANAELIAGAIPGARLEWLDGAGHVFWTDRTEESLGLIESFLDDIAAG